MKRSKMIRTLLLTPAILLFGFAMWPGEPYDDMGSPTPGLLQVTATAGSNQVFVFERWQFRSFSMEADNWETVQAVVEIDHNSLQNDWEELEASIRKKKDYFHAEKFPSSSVEISGASLQEDGSYLANAVINIKGLSKEIPVTFRVEDGVVTGGVTFNRRKYGFKGKGPENEVVVYFTFEDPR